MLQENDGFPPQADQCSGVSGSTGQERRHFNQEKQFLDLASKIGCYWVSHFVRATENVSWVEYNETQQSMAQAQPNLRKTIQTGIEQKTSFEVSYKNLAPRFPDT